MTKHTMKKYCTSDWCVFCSHFCVQFLFLLSSLLQHTTNNILHILVKAQPSIQCTGPQSPTRLGRQSQDLPNEYSLGHCNLFAASRHKLAFTKRHYALLTATDTTAHYQIPFFFLSRSKLIFKVPTTTS